MEKSTTPTANVSNEVNITLPPATHPNIQYAILSAQQVRLLRDRLEAELPYSLPLLRRLEFEDDHPSGKDAKVFAAKAVDQDASPTENEHDNADQDHTKTWLDAWLMSHTHTETHPSPPWLAAHIDLANQGQTQVFLYSSGSNPASGEFTSALQKEGARFLDGSFVFEDSQPPSPSPSSPLHPHLISTLFNYIHQTLIPLLPSTPSPDWFELKRTGKYLSTPYDRSKVIFGSIHESMWPYFLSYTSAITRTDTGYWKYIFEIPIPKPRARSRSQDPTLPTSYHISNLTPTHLQTALDRTPIPRTLETLRQFTSAGIFHLDEPNPVSWGFLSKDQSISSLHTEDEHRGKGLAGYVARELLRKAAAAAAAAAAVGKDEDEEGWEEDERERRMNDIYYGHADVSESNVGSRSVMEKLGGVPMWKTAWMEVNLRDVFEKN
ncbi:hypothetical protein PV10_01275 [Exophiala mesophila]|uniref:N-acetyltransferase domain-containing protein n=1 Tax=Exophiala mesophila TaxID=212818 RepID=A0A0D1YAC3_EXOME|nr:uncharacterized protein PV10_01275 [Exophiala mesophila]KIV97536.1 hypothetical protein PV10_01275 [Exophiala mesophila]